MRETVRRQATGDGPSPGTVLELFAAQVARRPEAVALARGTERLTYAELDRRAAELAAALKTRGVGPEVAVAIAAERSVTTAVGILAVLQAGAAYVPLDPTYPRQRLELIVADSRAKVLLTRDRLLVDLAGRDLEVISWHRETPATGPPPAASPAAAGAGVDDLAYAIFTSGSTGRPKGVAMRHGPLRQLIEWQLGASRTGPGDATVQLASPSFDVSFQELFATWCAGGTLVVAGDAVRSDPWALAELLTRDRVSRLFLPGVALRQLAEVGVEVAVRGLREVVHRRRTAARDAGGAAVLRPPGPDACWSISTGRPRVTSSPRSSSPVRRRPGRSYRPSVERSPAPVSTCSIVGSSRCRRGPPARW